MCLSVLTRFLVSSGQDVGSDHRPHPQQTHQHGHKVHQPVAGLQEEPGQHHEHRDHEAVQQLEHSTGTQRRAGTTSTSTTSSWLSFMALRPQAAAELRTHGYRAGSHWTSTYWLTQSNIKSQKTSWCNYFCPFSLIVKATNLENMSFTWHLQCWFISSQYLNNHRIY